MNSKTAEISRCHMYYVDFVEPCKQDLFEMAHHGLVEKSLTKKFGQECIKKKLKVKSSKSKLGKIVKDKDTGQVKIKFKSLKDLKKYAFENFSLTCPPLAPVQKHVPPPVPPKPAWVNPASPGPALVALGENSEMAEPPPRVSLAAPGPSACTLGRVRRRELHPVPATSPPPSAVAPPFCHRRRRCYTRRTVPPESPPPPPSSSTNTAVVCCSISISLVAAPASSPSRNPHRETLAGPPLLPTQIAIPLLAASPFLSTSSTASLEPIATHATPSLLTAAPPRPAFSHLPHRETLTANAAFRPISTTFKRSNQKLNTPLHSSHPCDQTPVFNFEFRQKNSCSPEP
ncbi:hypothetical protein LXL04_030587 [Taraxacum kok-saghyz]